MTEETGGDIVARRCRQTVTRVRPKPDETTSALATLSPLSHNRYLMAAMLGRGVEHSLR